MSKEFRPTSDRLSDPENEIGINKDVLKQQAFEIAGETLDKHKITKFVDDELYENMPSVYNLRDDVEHIDIYPSDEIERYAIHFCGSVESHYSWMTSAGSRHHPPEHDTEIVEVLFTLIFYPAANGGLGDAELEVEL